MTFLHISLLLGSIAVAAPILLHFLGRRQPKPIPFPAIRFVRQTAVSAQRGWSIKRWLLLALRILMVLSLALALASPRVPSGQYANYMAGGLLGVLASLSTAIAWGRRKAMWMIGTAAALAFGLWIFSGFFVFAAVRNSEPIAIGNSSGPVCAAIVIDTSPTMAYRYRNATRLEKAKEMATWLIDRLPVPSQIAILGGDSGARLNPDRRSTERQLDRVSVDGKATNLVDRIRTAIDLVRKSELERREIYVLTDLRDGAWRESTSSELPMLLGTKDSDGSPRPKILLQLIDVSAPDDELRNWSLGKLRLSQQSAVPGGRVTVSAEVQGTQGIQDDQLMCELVVEPIDRRLPSTQDGKIELPKGKVANRQLVQVPEGGSVPIQMSIADLVEGTNHASLRLSRPDPLELDNILYFTIEARTQGTTAIFSDDLRDGQLLSLLLDPSLASDRASGASGSKEPGNEVADLSTVVSGPSVESYSRLAAFDLGRVSNIVLYNPRSVSGNEADRLLEWVRGGGGLLIVLGPALQLPNDQVENGLQRLIPGELKRQTRRALDDRSIFLSPMVDNHPIWSIFERPVREIPWVNYPVFRHWDIEKLSPSATEIARLTGSEMPGLIEGIEGQGRIVVMTFPYPEPEATAQSEPWSELFTTSADAWPGFALLVGTARYLATQNKHPVNYTIDSIAVLDNNASQYPKVYELFTPSNEVVRLEADEDQVSYPFTRQPGQYRLRGLRPRGPVLRGFSVNIDRSEISLQRVPNTTLDQAIGPSNYGIAQEKEQVQTSIGEGRYGRDLAPFLMVVIVMMVMVEQTMASRFYTSQAQVRS